MLLGSPSTFFPTISNEFSSSIFDITVKTTTMSSSTKTTKTLSSTHKITTEISSSAHMTTTMTTFTETPILIGFKTTIGKNVKNLYIEKF